MNGLYSPFSSPFANPQPMTQMPLEVNFNNGQSMNIPGGVTTSPNGFNPVTGQITPAMGVQGSFNPYSYYQQQSMINHHPYGYDPMASAPFVPNMNSYGVYSPTFNLINPYGQNQYNAEIQEFLYNEDLSSIDATKLIEQVVLTKEDREKINHDRENAITGYDYYGRPIYNNGNIYQQNIQRQEQFEKERLEYQKFYTKLSKIAHAYNGETIDEEATMKRFDPFIDITPQQPVSNFAANREEYENNILYRQAQDICRRFDMSERMEGIKLAKRQELFDKIKESHDKLLGIEPGQSYDLKTYMENGYKIGINAAQSKARSEMRNGSKKYSRNDFRANLAMTTHSPIPITSKDDEYVSIEETLKGIYAKNKRTMSIMGTPNGAPVYGQNIPQFNSEQEAHQYFLQAMQDKKLKDDIRKSVI